MAKGDFSIRGLVTRSYVDQDGTCHFPLVALCREVPTRPTAGVVDVELTVPENPEILQMLTTDLMTPLASRKSLRIVYENRDASGEHWYPEDSVKAEIVSLGRPDGPLLRADAILYEAWSRVQ
jgi:hypothetical protein